MFINLVMQTFEKSNLQTITVYYILFTIYYCSEMYAIFAANHSYFSYVTVVCTACLRFCSRFVYPAHAQLLSWGDDDITENAFLERRIGTLNSNVLYVQTILGKQVIHDAHAVYLKKKRDTS